MSDRLDAIEAQLGPLGPKLESMLASYLETGRKVDELKSILENRGKNSPLSGVN